MKNAKPKRKNKPGAGRPNEGRVPLLARVLPETAKRIKARAAGSTIGKVLDETFKG